MSVLSRLCRSRFPCLQKYQAPPPIRLFRTKRSGGTGVGKDHVGSQPMVESHSVPTVGLSSLLRPALFFSVFSASSLVGCAIWQYENMREAARRSKLLGFEWQGDLLGRKAGTIREELRQWWNKLPDSEKLFIPICFLNCLVFAAWRIPSLQPVMLTWFSANPGARATCIPMILSAFSHYSAFHLAANMFVLHSFMGPAVRLLGQEQFLAVYLTSAAFTSLCSYVYKVGVGRMGYSLGASGAICAVLGIFGTVMPDATLHIILLPMLTFSASTAIKGMMAMDSVGMVLGWRFFDHAAHLSGILFGIFWCHLGSRLLWDSREPAVTAWHRFRTTYGKS